MTIADWIGRFRPDHINVIPLFEEMDHMLDAHNVVRRYLEDKDIDHQRVFLARSDPAMNYGIVSAVLLNKIALQHLQEVSEETGTRIYPIIGVGSAPFRGGLSPGTVDRVIAEYRASTPSPSSPRSSMTTRSRTFRTRSGGWRSGDPKDPSPLTRQRRLT